MNKWYVIQTKPQREDHVTRHFKNAGFNVFNPKVKSFKFGIKPLFPNYVFLHWDLLPAENFHMIRFTRGVNKVLGSQDKPVPISDAVVQAIQERVNDHQILEHKIMRVGSRVKVKNGILSDLIGVLERPVSADGRVTVLLRLFERDYEREMRAILACKDLEMLAA
ncbi:MAG: hypothetical protein HQM16_07895 [Deltaproteobacteria bacterium]|nr:hypothetical protein [Deltaproteobacteria bacterium]